MSKCMYCSEEVVSEGKKPKLYCSDRCRKAYTRRKEQTDKRTLIKKRTQQTDNFENCRYCGTGLPKLMQPRKYSGACYQCALDQPSKGQTPATDGHSVSSTPITVRTHKLTVMERLFYQPASELMPGEHNFISLPGRACYGVYE